MEAWHGGQLLTGHDHDGDQLLREQHGQSVCVRARLDRRQEPFDCLCLIGERFPCVERRFYH